MSKTILGFTFLIAAVIEFVFTPLVVLWILNVVGLISTGITFKAWAVTALLIFVGRMIFSPRIRKH